MRRKTMTPQLPVAMYDQSQPLRRRRVPIRPTRLTTGSSSHPTARLTAPREQIRLDGGLHVGATKDEVVERLRRTRCEMFAAEYACTYG